MYPDFGTSVNRRPIVIHEGTFSLFPEGAGRQPLRGAPVFLGGSIQSVRWGQEITSVEVTPTGKRYVETIQTKVEHEVSFEVRSAMWCSAPQDTLWRRNRRYALEIVWQEPVSRVWRRRLYYGVTLSNIRDVSEGLYGVTGTLSFMAQGFLADGGIGDIPGTRAPDLLVQYVSGGNRIDLYRQINGVFTEVNPGTAINWVTLSNDGALVTDITGRVWSDLRSGVPVADGFFPGVATEFPRLDFLLDNVLVGSLSNMGWRAPVVYAVNAVVPPATGFVLGPATNAAPVMAMDVTGIQAAMYTVPSGGGQSWMRYLGAQLQILGLDQNWYVPWLRVGNGTLPTLVVSAAGNDTSTPNYRKQGVLTELVDDRGQYHGLILKGVGAPQIMAVGGADALGVPNYEVLSNRACWLNVDSGLFQPMSVSNGVVVWGGGMPQAWVRDIGSQRQILGQDRKWYVPYGLMANGLPTFVVSAVTQDPGLQNMRRRGGMAELWCTDNNWRAFFLKGTGAIEWAAPGINPVVNDRTSTNRWQIKNVDTGLYQALSVQNGAPVLGVGES